MGTKRRKNLQEMSEKQMGSLMDYYSNNPKYAIYDGAAVILGLIILIFSVIKMGVITGLTVGIVAVLLLLIMSQVLKKMQFEEPNGMIVEEEPEEPAFVTYNGMQPGEAKRLKQKEKEDLAAREANGEFILGAKDVKKIEKEMKHEERAEAKAEKKAEKQAAKEEEERLKFEQQNAALDLSTLEAATANKETLAQKVGKGINTIVDAKNSVKGTLLKGKSTLDEFADLVVSKGTMISELMGEPIFSNAELNKSAPLNVKVDNGVYSGAFELVEVQKVPYYGYNSVLMKLLDGEMFTYFDTAVPWTNTPFNASFIGEVDKLSKTVATLSAKSARIAIWIKKESEVYLLETSFISSNSSDANAFNDIKKYMLTTILSKVGKEANNTYIDCGICEEQEEVLLVAKAAQASKDKSLILGQSDFKIPDILLGIQGSENTIVDTPANIDYIIGDLEGVELKRCVNTTDSEYTLFTYSLDALASKKFFNNSESLIKLNTTVFKPALVRDMIKWVVGQYSEVADSIAFDISTGVGQDTIHVLSSVNGITFDNLVDVPDSFLCGLFRMNSSSIYGGVSKPTDIRVIIHSTGRELLIDAEDYKIKKIGKMAAKE